MNQDELRKRMNNLETVGDVNSLLEEVSKLNVAGRNIILKALSENMTEQKKQQFVALLRSEAVKTDKAIKEWVEKSIGDVYVAGMNQANSMIGATINVLDEFSTSQKQNYYALIKAGFTADESKNAILKEIADMKGGAGFGSLRFDTMPKYVYVPMSEVNVNNAVEILENAKKSWFYNTDGKAKKQIAEVVNKYPFLSEDNKLPDKLTIFRGVNEGNTEATSWTTSKSIAQKFGEVESKTISKEDVFLNLNNSEKEIWLKEDFLKTPKQKNTVELTFSKLVADKSLEHHLTAVKGLMSDAYLDFGNSMTGFVRGAERVLNEQIKRQLRNELAVGRLEGKSIRDIKKSVTELFKEKGFTVLLDKGGRQWELERYSELIARTHIIKANNEAVINRATDFKIDVVEISSHGTKDELCSSQEGKLYSISGEHDEYDKLDGNEPPYHPNCKHTLLLRPDIK